MKKIYLIIIVTLSLPIQVLSQDNKERVIPNDSLKQIAREIILSSTTCTLISLDEQGRARARIMEVLEPDANFTIWFGTNPKSRKVKQIMNDSRVTLLYKDHDASGYVMLYGKAEIVSDPIQKEKRWKEEWTAYYKDREHDFVLIKVSPEWMEIVSNSRNIMGHAITWEPQKIWLNPSK